MKGDFLKQILKETGLDGLPSIQVDMGYLLSRLTGDELAAVGSLLELSLLQTHHVRHLPVIQAWRIIRGEHGGQETGGQRLTLPLGV